MFGKIKRSRLRPIQRSLGIGDAVVASLLNEIWGIQQLPSRKDAGFYLEHYSACMASLSNHRDVLSPNFRPHVAEIVEFVKKGKSKTLGAIKQEIVSKAPKPSWLVESTDKAAQKAVEFGINLWLMVDAIGWTDDVRLCDYIEALFPKTPYIALQHNLGKEEITFNARSLYRVAGLELVWTSHIAKHLRLDCSSSQLYIFRHASFLDSRWSANSSDIFPAGLIQETAETMALLFPCTESPSRNWDRRIRRKADVDIESGLACNTPQVLSHYVYWGARLKAIQDHLDNARPRKLRQWVFDRRDSNQLATFWFAMVAIVLTLLFGLIQSVTGILQVSR